MRLKQSQQRKPNKKGYKCISATKFIQSSEYSPYKGTIISSPLNKTSHNFCAAFAASAASFSLRATKALPSLILPKL